MLAYCWTFLCSGTSFHENTPDNKLHRILSSAYMRQKSKILFWDKGISLSFTHWSKGKNTKERDIRCLFVRVHANLQLSMHWLKPVKNYPVKSKLSETVLSKIESHYEANRNSKFHDLVNTIVAVEENASFEINTMKNRFKNQCFFCTQNHNWPFIPILIQ